MSNMPMGNQSNTRLQKSVSANLIKKVSSRNYGAYLLSVNIIKLRAYKNATVRFDFPVTALVGPNGGGKSTVLGAAGLIFKKLPPRSFFAKSGKYDASMQNWRVEYDLIDRVAKSSGTLTRTASYLKYKWNRDAVERPVLLFGVSRTIPATERRDLSTFIGGTVNAKLEEPLTASTIAAVEQILGKKADRYLQVGMTVRSEKRLYASVTPEGDAYSEFHFGAGEASVIRIVDAIEKSPENSLILIEEIENGLHPVATRRLVEYLIQVAGRKSCQVIFTSHSNDALIPLPDEAVWACFNGEVNQGKLDVNTLRTLTGEVKASLAVFVEDIFAVSMIEAALRVYSHDGRVAILGIHVHSVNGEGNVVKLTQSHNENPSIHFPAIGVLDGDMAAKADVSMNLVSFPGSGDPEQYVVDRIGAELEKLGAKLTIALGMKIEHQERVVKAVRGCVISNLDPHLLFVEIGQELDFLGEEYVRNAFLNLWANEFPLDVDELLIPLQHVLPNDSKTLDTDSA